LAAQLLTLGYAVACIFFAAVVRGYSGFGFSLLAITSLSLLLPPVQIVPSIFLMEVVASLHLLPGVCATFIGVRSDGCSPAAAWARPSACMRWRTRRRRR